jgi:hypothetical protein
LAYELPSLKIIGLGLLPNEIKWLESFVDFIKVVLWDKNRPLELNLGVIQEEY